MFPSRSGQTRCNRRRRRGGGSLGLGTPGEGAGRAGSPEALAGGPMVSPRGGTGTPRGGTRPTEEGRAMLGSQFELEEGDFQGEGFLHVGVELALQKVHFFEVAHGFGRGYARRHGDGRRL